MSRTLKYEIPGDDPRRAISDVAEAGWPALFEAGCGLESVLEGSMVLEIGFGHHHEVAHEIGVRITAKLVAPELEAPDPVRREPE